MGDRDATQEPSPAPWRVERYDEVDSTNRLVLERAGRDEPDGLVVVADFQTEGRGRLDRTWVAPPGSSLLVSVLVRSGPSLVLRPDRLHLVTMAASLALAEAVEAMVGAPVMLKWPNDLVVGDRKLAGVLSEAVWSGGGQDGQVDAVVVGLGCNVYWDTLPPELADRATACNLVSDVVVDRDELLEAFLARLDAHRARLGPDPESVVNGYRDRLSTLGRDVRVDLGDRVVEGRATDLDVDGHLVVTPPDQAPLIVAAGDVIHLR